MCGLTFFLTNQKDSVFEQVENMVQSIKNRGPDSYDQQYRSLPPWHLYIACSVLHTQGKTITKQPLVSADDNILLWNGDIFDGELVSKKPDHISDTEIVISWLGKNNGNVPRMVTLISGPYSFVYLDSERKRLWIGRDPLGRHSLLWKISTDEMLITSVGHKNVQNLAEVPAAGLFCFSLIDDHIDLNLYEWSHWKFYSSSSLALPVNLSIVEPFLQYFQFDSARTSDYGSIVPIFTPEISRLSSRIDIIEDMLRQTKIVELVEKFTNLLNESCRKRVTVRNSVCKDCSTASQCSSSHVKIGVLFSGGIDSTVVAFLADKYVPSTEHIDLINVAFRKNGTFDVPDRITSRMSLQELRTVCPDRVWNLVEINITDEELEETRENRISHLIYPLDTILDESLGCALWFACRGEGSVNGCPYTSSAKILLLGSGADEQLGGYTRHVNLLKRNGWDELGSQLLRETLEIWKRNLGRDDRIASDSGRQPRFPYLDESLVEFIATLPPWQRCDPLSFPPGLGDKLLLRLTAAKLGLKQCATFPKRAFQFGCRIARPKEKGTSRSVRL